MARKAHSEEKKAQVMAALLEGQSVREAAKEYRVPVSTVKNWSSQLNDGPVRTIKKGAADRIGALIERYLEATLETLVQQSEAFRDSDWLKGQDASEVAVLHGVLMDKSVRILEAAEAARQEEPEDGVQPG